MATEFAAWVDAAPDWTRVAPTPLATVAFAFTPSGREGQQADATNLRIIERVNRSGEVFLTHTALAGRVVLRLSIGNLRTTPARVLRAWQLLQEAAAEEGGAASD
jgi:aromatic-L-amino-acid decarboxylase